MIKSDRTTGTLSGLISRVGKVNPERRTRGPPLDPRPPQQICCFYHNTEYIWHACTGSCISQEHAESRQEHPKDRQEHPRVARMGKWESGRVREWPGAPTKGPRSSEQGSRGEQGRAGSASRGARVRAEEGQGTLWGGAGGRQGTLFLRGGRPGGQTFS